MHLTLRPATFADADQLLAWRNDASVRDQSLDSEAIARETHLVWLERRLASPAETRIYIVEENEKPLGYVRLDRVEGGRGEISIALTAETRGAGAGRLAIAVASQRGAAELELSTVDAVIKASNAASRRAFAAAGYRGERTERRQGEDVIVTTWRMGRAKPR